MAQPTNFQLFKWFLWHYKEVPILSTVSFGLCTAIAIYHGNPDVAIFFASIMIGIIPVSLYVFHGQKASIKILYQWEQEWKATLGAKI